MARPASPRTASQRYQTNGIPDSLIPTAPARSVHAQDAVHSPSLTHTLTHPLPPSSPLLHTECISSPSYALHATPPHPTLLHSPTYPPVLRTLRSSHSTPNPRQRAVTQYVRVKSSKYSTLPALPRPPPAAIFYFLLLLPTPQLFFVHFPLRLLYPDPVQLANHPSLRLFTLTNNEHSSSIILHLHLYLHLHLHLRLPSSPHPNSTLEYYRDADFTACSLCFQSLRLLIDLSQTF